MARPAHKDHPPTVWIALGRAGALHSDRHVALLSCTSMLPAGTRPNIVQISMRLTFLMAFEDEDTRGGRLRGIRAGVLWPP